MIWRMSPASPQRPFRPGFGGAPPYLAGREDEQQLLREQLAELAGGDPPGTALFLYGPRGNGKTTLLGWLERETGESFQNLDALFLTPSRVPTLAKLAEHIAPRTWLASIRPSEVKIPVLVATVAWGLEGGPLPPLEELLEARVRIRPLLLILDEAHTLTPEVGHAVLNAAQVVARRLPFLLVLAGTPDLPARLRDMNASFWGRGVQIRVGRLKDAAAADAIRVPLGQRGVSVTHEVLEPVVRDCHGYPYFTQVWGDAIWREICRGASAGPRPEVTAADRDRARERFEQTRDTYYQLRYREIADERLLAAARSVADAFVAVRDADGGRESALSYEQLDAAVERGLGAEAEPGQALAARRRLGDLGFIWGTARGPFWEPGIPNLMDYVRRYAPATGTGSGFPPRSN